MKNYKSLQILLLNLIGLLIITGLGCKKRDVSELQNVSFPKNGDVFIDDFTGDLGYGAFGGSDVRAFQVDSKETYNNSRQSMRFDVPDANSPLGSYAGGVFISNTGRDLSGFTALTFYIKANQAINVGEIGFGNDFGANKYVVSITDLPVTTAWKKVIIPIPDPAKLKGEKGLMYYSSGPINNRGYTFWIDEVKFENLGTINLVRSAINNGNNTSTTTFVGVNTTIGGIISTYSLPTGVNQTINLSREYFVFKSSNTAVSTVNSNGVASSLSAGTSVITATIGGVQASGSVTINCAGTYNNAPRPTRNAANVISVFSDAYTNVPVRYYNGYWQPWQTTVSNDFVVNGDNVLNYGIFNFVGIEFGPSVNASNMSHFHADFFFPGAIVPGRQLRIILVDFGADGAFGGGDDTRHSTTFTAPTLVSQNWVQIDIPFASMTGLASRSNIGQIIFEGGDGGTMYVDNIYFWNTAPSIAAPVPTYPAASVISLYSDSYTNVAGSNINPGWGQATVVSQAAIGGNNMLVYNNLNYQGFQIGSNQNLTGKQFLHLDYYTLNSTALNVYLISPPGSPGGQAPFEKAVPLTVPTTTGWNSIDIPLTSFTPQVALNNVFQLKFDGNGTIYLDNILFR